MSIVMEAPRQADGADGHVVSASTDAVPAAERFDWWVEMVGDKVMPVTIHSPHDTLPVETRKAALLARIKVFIEHNLGDPELLPAAIAAQSTATTPGTWEPSPPGSRATSRARTRT
ncbi:hypothetical protein [Streptomyces sp. SM11]|uniref:hypothetical protein n=1 Tax=Streptomyces sp. SM11 TaxID=565557 RepID=UPI001CA58DD3|nr:hypothetical protein [Streptomyces sp. SM11]